MLRFTILHPVGSDPVILEEEDNSKNRGTFQNGDRVRMDGVSHPSVVLYCLVVVF